MHHEVDGKRQAGAPHDRRYLALLFLRPGHPGHAVAIHIIGILKTDLNVVEPGFSQSVHARLIKQHGGGNEITVKSHRDRVPDQIHKVSARCRFTAGKMHLKRADVGRLGEHVAPLRGRQLALYAGKPDRIGAIRTLQRTPMGQLRKNSKRRFDGDRGPRH